MVKFLFLFLVLSSSLQAAIHTGTIEYIDEAQDPKEASHLYLSDGFVLKVNNEKEILDYEEAREDKIFLRFVVDDDRKIISVTSLGKLRNPVSRTGKPFVYEPTVLDSLTDAQKIFNSLRRGSTSWSQCYNRAHVWAYESKKVFNLDSMKVFMFYTRKYIREYNFQWWFHVSPFTYTMEDGAKTERVLDFKFTRGPLHMKNWTDIFMKNKVECPVITKYSEYENNQEAQYCYLYKASMYYLQPLDLDNNERTGATKSEWLNYEVKRAYRNGFGVWP